MTLATVDQQVLEALALRLYADPAVQAAAERMRDVMRAAPQAGTTAGRATLEQNLAEWTFSACFNAAAMDPVQPRVGWTINLPHRWRGRDVPGSRHGVDNPDNIYRVIAVDPAGRYAIHGRVQGEPGADVSFSVFSAYPGDGADSHSLGLLTLDEIDRDEQGCFTVTLDANASDGRRNHLTLQPSAKLVFVRDSLLDWAVQAPLALSVERLDCCGDASPDEASLAARAAAAVERAVPYWVASMPKWFGRLPPNVVPPAGMTNFAYAKQASIGASWRLGDDEALRLRLDRLGAAYLGVQVADPWGASPDYSRHACSLNAVQAQPDDDGLFTFVVAPRDPGVRHWIDTAGLGEGTLMVRWQGLPAGGIDLAASLREARVLRSRDLAGPRIDAAERRALLEALSAAYARRLA